MRRLQTILGRRGGAEHDPSAAPGMRTYGIVWLGQTISALGSRMSGFAVALWLFAQTHQATTLALVGLAYGIPTVLVNLFAGALVDRLDRKLLIWLSEAVGGGVAIAYLALLLAGHLQPWQIYTSSAIRGAFGILQSLAFSASVAVMVPKSQYVRTSAMDRFTNYAGNIIGPALGAAAYYAIGFQGVLLIDIATFGVSIATVLANRIPRPEPVASVELGAPAETLAGRIARQLARWWASVSFGFRYTLGRPGLLALMLAMAALNFCDGVPNAIQQAMVLTRTGNNAGILAAVGVSAGIGGVSSALILTIWGGPRRNRARITLLGITAAGLAKLGIGLSRAAPGWCLCQGTASSTFPLTTGAEQAIWLEKVDPALQGRVFATRMAVSQLAFYLSFAFAAPLGDYVFEPALARHGWLVPVVGWLMGSGPGVGYSFEIVLAAVAMAAGGAIGFLIPSLLHVEAREPDFAPRQRVRVGAAVAAKNDADIEEELATR
jgi:MFS family permease